MAARRVDAVLLTDSSALLFGILTDKMFQNPLKLRDSTSSSTQKQQPQASLLGIMDFIFGNNTSLLEHCHIQCKYVEFQYRTAFLTNLLHTMRTPKTRTQVIGFQKENRADR
ncbi:uncharacterized protein LOC131657029 [Vicia villosa]|uniref:uncharacterized protein LOC131657029 n=1 Tax=Vicia villosa TaxID=3911 RepID=UPI00273A885A|nr:uncharacterized protein LOC131657029 [Vicia villosa]